MDVKRERIRHIIENYLEHNKPEIQLCRKCDNPCGIDSIFCIFQNIGILNGADIIKWHKQTKGKEQNNE